jgi:hypothetical protein
MRLAIGAALAMLGLLAAGTAGPAEPRELWLYYGVNLAADPEVAKLEAVWRRAAAAGYRHVMLADPKFARLGQMDAHYFENVRRVRSLAATLHLEIVPCVFQVGRAGTMLATAPDLAEALPVRHAQFVVRGGTARLAPDPAVAFGTRPDWRDPNVGWSPELASVRDNGFRARFMYRVRVQPFRCYHVSVEIRTAEFTGLPLIQVLADGQPIHFTKTLGARPSQPWTRHDILFNSLDHSRVEVYFGVWRAARGTLDWRRWRIEESGPVNLVRRPGAPLVVAGRVEGRDFAPLSDSLLGRTPWPGNYDEWHEPPALKTSLPEGTRLDVSWYHAAVVYGQQVACCLSDTAVDARLRDEARRVRAAWAPSGLMMMHDEIRAIGWDAVCAARGLTPGALLAGQVRRCVAMLKGATVYVWNDMFDPYQNAVRDYHLVNGDLSGSWKGLGPEVVIVNWNAARRDESLRFFASTGHRQVIAGYYDSRPEGIRDWLRSARDVPGVIGIMYTTWRQNYDDLEAFARACRTP